MVWLNRLFFHVLRARERLTLKEVFIMVSPASQTQESVQQESKDAVQDFERYAPHSAIDGAATLTTDDRDKAYFEASGAFAAAKSAAAGIADKVAQHFEPYIAVESAGQAVKEQVCVDSLEMACRDMEFDRRSDYEFYGKVDYMGTRIDREALMLTMDPKVVREMARVILTQDLVSLLGDKPVTVQNILQNPAARSIVLKLAELNIQYPSPDYQRPLGVGRFGGNGRVMGAGLSGGATDPGLHGGGRSGSGLGGGGGSGGFSRPQSEPAKGSERPTG